MHQSEQIPVFQLLQLGVEVVSSAIGKPRSLFVIQIPPD
jgi:hypothetical protein